MKASPKNSDQTLRDNTRKQILDVLVAVSESLDQDEKFTSDELSKLIEKEIFEVTGCNPKEKFYREKTKKIINRLRGNLNSFVRKALITEKVKVNEFCRFNDKQLELDSIYKNNDTQLKKIPHQIKNKISVIKPPKIRSLNNSGMNSRENSFGNEIEESYKCDQEICNEQDKMKINPQANFINNENNSETIKICDNETNIIDPSEEKIPEKISNFINSEQFNIDSSLIKESFLINKDEYKLPQDLIKRDHNFNKNKDYLEIKLKLLEFESRYSNEKIKNEILTKDYNKIKDEFKNLKASNIHFEYKNQTLVNEIDIKNQLITKLKIENTNIKNLLKHREGEYKKVIEDTDNFKTNIEERLNNFIANKCEKLYKEKKKYVDFRLNNNTNNNIKNESLNQNNCSNQHNNLFGSNELENSFSKFLNKTLSTLPDEKKSKNKIILNQMNHTNIFNNANTMNSIKKDTNNDKYVKKYKKSENYDPLLTYKIVNNQENNNLQDV